MNLPKPLRRWLGWFTMDDLLDHYEQVIQTRTYWAYKTVAQRRSDIKHIRRSDLAHMRLKAIRPHHIARLLKQFMDIDRASVAANLLLALRDIFNEAILLGWLHSNPALQVRAPRSRIKRSRLTLEQWRMVHQHLLRHQPPWVARAWVLALVTGQRCADLVKMRFSDVQDGLLLVRQQKRGARVAIPLALRLDALDLTVHQAVAACRARYAKEGTHLLRSFNGESLCAKTLSGYISVAVRAAGVPVAHGMNPPSLHEARSLAARLYMEQGIDVQVLLGHKHASMTDRYLDDRGLNAGHWQIVPLPPTIQP